MLFCVFVLLGHQTMDRIHWRRPPADAVAWKASRVAVRNQKYKVLKICYVSCRTGVRTSVTGRYSGSLLMSCGSNLAKNYCGGRGGRPLIQDVSGGIVNILEGGSMDYSE